MIITNCFTCARISRSGVRSEGIEKTKWIDVVRKELTNPTSMETIEPISADDPARLGRTARLTGNKLIELLAKGASTIKPEKQKVCFVVCGKKFAETYGKVSTQDDAVLSFMGRISTRPFGLCA